MEHQESLFAISEFAIGLAGFGAIVVAIGGRGGELEEEHGHLFRLLLIHSV